MAVLHRKICFSFLIIFCTFSAVAGVAQGPAARCSFNQGNCPLDQGFVQDYGYGGLTSTGAVVAGAVANPLGSVVNAVVQGGPPNPECVYSVGTAVTTFAGRAWNGAGGDATRAELEAIQCAGENGRAYMLRGSNVQELINTTANLDQIQEELVFLTAVDHIRQFNECQNGLFRSYFDNPVARQEMLENAWRQFDDIKEVTRPAITEEYQRRARRASADAVRYCTRENCPTPTVQDIATMRTSGENTARINELREGINALISRIPMANRDSMRTRMEILLMSNPLPNRQQFQATFDAEMRKLDESVQQSRNFIRSITVDDREDHRLYCVDRGLKQNIYRSGQLETTVQAMGLEDILQNFSTRAANRYGMAGEIITEVALIPTYFVGYGAARLALRAGASSVRAVAQGGRALASVTRGAMLGIEAADYGTAIAAAMNDCDSDEFMARVNGVSCNPADEIGQVYEEASMAQCVTSTLLPFASAIAGTTTRIINTPRLSALYSSSRPGEEIVIYGSRNPARRGFLNGEQTDAAMASLERKGIRLDANLGDRVIDPRVAARLTNNERVQLVNEIAGTNLNPDQARSVLRLAGQMRRGNDVARSEAELSRILRAAGVPDDEIAASARKIISSNTLGATPRPRPNGAITVARQETPTPGAVPDPSPSVIPEPQRITANTPGTARLSPDEPNAVPVGDPAGPRPRLTADEIRELNRRGLADPFQRTDNVNGLSADVENAMNLEDLARVYRQWDGVSPGLKNDIFNFLDGVTDLKTRQRYFAILINANNGNPTEVLSRLRRLKANPNSKAQILRELDAQIGELGNRLNSDPGRNFSLEDVARARSALLVERTLIDEGDNLEIVGIFSSNAHNQYYSGLGYNPNSAGNTFSLDVKPRQGSELRLCRGSFAGRATSSNLVGGFFTFCRDMGYIDTPSFGNNLAAPRDTTTRSAARQGTSRISAFGFDDSQTITLGQNGPVRYSGYGQEGSGGVGGAIEFFGDRRRSRLTTANLQASVRNPVCIRRAGSNCEKIFEIQERIRAGDLTASSGPQLQQARRDLNTLIEGMLPEARRAVDNIDNFPFETNVDVLFDNNPELISALNLRREIELKEAALGNARTGQRFPLDEESAQFARYTDESRGLGQNFTLEGTDSFNQVRAKLESVLAEARNSSAVRAYNTSRGEIARDFGRLAVTENAADPVGELYSVTQRLGRMDDAYNGIRGLAGGLSRTIDRNPNLTATQIGELRRLINQTLPGNTDFGPLPTRLERTPAAGAITVTSGNSNGNTNVPPVLNSQPANTATAVPEVPRTPARVVTGAGGNRLGPPPPPATVIAAIREKNLQHVRLTPAQTEFIDNLVERHNGNAMSEAEISALMDNSSGVQNPARPFRGDRITSFFPAGTGPDDVMAAYSRGDLRFIISNGSTRKFQGEVNGNRYTMYVCEAETCVANGITVRRNEVTSISPECGPDIRALPKLSRAKDVLRQSGPVTRDSFFELMSCRD